MDAFCTACRETVAIDTAGQCRKCGSHTNNSTERADDGGSAFPNQQCGPDGLPTMEAETGMALRDWFAGQALAGIIEADGAQYFSQAYEHARLAYEHADAMLKFRNPQND